MIKFDIIQNKQLIMFLLFALSFLLWAAFPSVDNKQSITYDNLCVISYVDSGDADNIEQSLKVTPFFNTHIAPLSADVYHLTVKRYEGKMTDQHLDTLKIFRYALAQYSYTASNFEVRFFV